MPDRRIKGSRAKKRRLRGVEVPINIERILLAAARDGAFCGRLLDDPARTAREGGVELTASELAMLSSMDRSALEGMIRSFGSLKKRRGAFAGKVAAALAGSMIITVSACGDEQTRGIEPDVPPDVELDAFDGISPDMPPDVVDALDAVDDAVDGEQDAEEVVEEEADV